MAIIWSKNAADELLEIVCYQKYNVGKVPARDAYTRIRNKVERISLNPDVGEAIPELVEVGLKHIYQLAESPWLICYKVDNKNICILSIMDVRKDLEEMLYSKFLEGKII